MAPIASSKSTGTSGVQGAGGWHPTILYLIALVAAEIFAVGLLSRTLLR